MADSTESTDTSNLSEAEKRRLRRRQRILENPEARLQRILNGDSSNQKQDSETSPCDDHPGTFDSSSASDSITDKFNAESLDSKEFLDALHEKSKTLISSIGKKDKGQQPSIAASLLEELSASGLSKEPESESSSSEIRLGIQSDGTVILPHMSHIYGRVLLCLLALFLSICNAKRLLVTFMSLEVSYYFLNGLPPLPPPNMAMVLAAVMGLQENQLSKVKKIIHFSNCVLIDFSLFLAFTMMPHVVKSVTNSFSV